MNTQRLGKVLYGAAFTVLLPVLLVVFADRLHVPFPAYQSLAAGVPQLVIGLILMAAGISSLMTIGQGLPMNAFPPQRLVTRQIYGLVPHPIYVGFVFACAGVSLMLGSASGLWVITPLAALGSAALVWGHERPFLMGTHHALAEPWLGAHRDGTLRNRIGTMAAVMLPWLTLFYAIKLLGAPPDAMVWYLPGEQLWPVLPWTYPVYASAYLLVPLTFLIAPADAVRRLFLRGWAGIALMGVLYLSIPVTSPPRPLDANGLLAQLLRQEMAHAAPYTAAFPSYHVVWAVLCAAAVTEKGRSWRFLGWTIALAISLSCISTGMHLSVDVIAGIVVGALLARMETLWAWLRQYAETLANSFRSVRFGPVRVLSHFTYSFIAGGLCLFLVQMLMGPGNGILAFCTQLAGLVGAALWGQYLEGSSRLQRPFGYFGSVVGVAVFLPILALCGFKVWPLLAAAACAAPWVQAAGRLRCVVQGCCHGRALEHQAAAPIGIVVRNPHSRVAGISGLAGRAIYPTQLFSIIGNLGIGLLLFRSWTLSAPVSAICGLYLILSGLLRFVEEGYRGETQTPIRGGLPVYQWLAAAMLALGAVLLCMPSPTVPGLTTIDWTSCALWGLVGGLVTGFAMSIDFPESTRRFTRLSG